MEFTIVTAVTPEYLALLYWNIGSWIYKPQFKCRPLIVYYNGLPERKLRFVKKLFNDVRLIPWEMQGIESKSELMFSSFVFGAARDVKTPYYMKLDADAYCINSADVWDSNDEKYDLVGHKWHYTKPGYFIQQLDNYYNKTDNPVDLSLRHFKHRRIESYCCLHRTEWVRNVAAKFNGRLPVPSHDTSLWYYADKEGKWLAKDIKSIGVGNARNWRTAREVVCSGDTAFNQLLDEQLLFNVQIEITSRCNIGCFQCDRNCGVMPPAQDMQINQIWKFVEESLKAGKQWSRIDIIGGEPTLHKHLKTVIEIIGIYHNKYPRTKMRFSTNGLGDNNAEILKTLPEWVIIRNSEKHGKDQPHTVYHDSPSDHGISGIKACSVPWRCGLGLTQNGYFPCGAGAALARAFGMDIGIKELSSVNPVSIKRQMIQLCRHCGHSNSMEHKPAIDNSMSESWKKAVENYKQEAMSIY
jgi:hypothetical protein